MRARLLLLTCLALACSNDDDRGRFDISQNPATATEDGGDPRSVPPGQFAGGPGNVLPSGVIMGGSGTASMDASVLDASADAARSDDSAVPAAFACTTNNDCAIRNVGSCCGAYPRCANANAVFSTPNCTNMTVNDCTFPPIDSCRCEFNQCVSLQAGVPIKFP